MLIKKYKNGNGNKTIYLSADDEGNSFHQMFYAFTEIDEDRDILEWKKHTNKEIKDKKKFMENLYLGIDYKDMKKSIILG